MTANPDKRWLFTMTIFAGSFLLFLVQPMVARMALPQLGGAPNVWNSAMLVYQALLLAGYAYAHALGRFAIRRQVMIHLAVLLLAALTLPIALARISSPPAGLEVIWVPWLFLLTVGPAFFAVSAQAPLVQRWYAAHPQAGNPYPLYAASNLGSFAGLLAYPLLLEPALPTSSQSLLWAAGYGVLVLLVASLWLARGHKVQLGTEQAHALPQERPGWRRIVLWLALSAVPSPGAIFSTIDSDRWVEAISTVRSGVTRPRWMARPASIHSAAITTSTSPGTGISDSTGWRPGWGRISST